MRCEVNPPITDFMHRDPVCMTLQTAARDAAIRLKRTGQSVAVVVDDRGFPQGVVTSAQLLSHCIPCLIRSKTCPEFARLPVARIMNQTIGVAEESVCLADLRPALLTESRHAIVVTRADGTVSGILTSCEYARAFRFLLNLSKLESNPVENLYAYCGSPRVKTNYFSGVDAA